jgi:hypothetical protein
VLEQLNRAIEFIGGLSPWAFALTAIATIVMSALQGRQYARAMKLEETLGKRDQSKFTVSLRNLPTEGQDELVHSVQHIYLRVRQKYGEQDFTGKTFEVNLPAHVANSTLSTILENLSNTNPYVVSSGKEDKE